MLDKIILIGLIGIVFFVPVVVTDSTTVGFTLPKHLLAQVLLSIVILTWLINPPLPPFIKGGRLGGLRRMGTPLDMAIIVFLIFILVSFRNTTNTAISLKGFTNIMGYVLLYYMLASNLNEEQHIRWMVGAIVLAGLLVSILGILEYVGVGIFKWDKPITQQVQMWVTMGNSNAVAQYLIMVIPVAVGIMLHSENLKWMIVWACIISIMCSCLVLTFAKGAWLGLSVALLFFVALNARKKIALMSMTGVAAVLLIISFLVLIQPLILLPSPTRGEGRVGGSGIGKKLAQIFREEDKDATFSGRVVMWQSSMRMIQVHPFIGSGLNNFYLLFPKYQVSKFNEVLPNRRPMQVHNDYIQLAVEVGILGLAAFLWIVVRYLKYGMRVIRSDKDAAGNYKNTEILRPNKSGLRMTESESNSNFKWLTSGLVCGIIALLSHSLTDFGLQMPTPAMMMWAFMGITVAVGEKETLHKVKHIYPSGVACLPLHTKIPPYPPLIKGGIGGDFKKVGLLSIYLIFIIMVAKFSLMPFMAHLAYQRGNRLIMSGRVESAVKEYEKAVRLDNSLTDGHSTLGSLYAEQGRYAQAIEELKKAIEIDNYSIEARISLAGIHRRLGEYDKSIKELEFVIGINPNLALARSLLEMVHEEAKRLLRPSGSQ